MTMPVDKPALVSLTFDDGLRCQFERAVPILRQYGFPATFFLIANPDSTQEPWDGHINDWLKIDWREEDISMLRKVIQDGHEIGAHSVHHRHPFLGNDPRGEAEGSKQWIYSRLGIEILS
jgi:peptidoglycan/xylan/chitin deacetylase (PgdA/CDA1 family)